MHQETGLECDQYTEFEPDQEPLSTDEKRAILSEKKQEKPLFYLSDIYKKVSVHSISDLMQQMQTNYQAGRVFSTAAFAPLNTPQEFNYTVRGREREVGGGFNVFVFLWSFRASSW